MTLSMDAPLVRDRWAERRPFLYLAVVAATLFLLLPEIIGFQRVVQLLQKSEPVFVALAIGTETVRFLLSAASTRLLGRLFERKIPFEPLVETFFVGSAVNRTFSTGGAPGMVVRLLFLMRQHLSAGSVAVIFAIEDIVGFVIGSLIFIGGIVALSPAQPRSSLIIKLALSLLLGSLLIALGLLSLYRHRAYVQVLVHGLARRADDLVKWIAGRSIYSPAHVQRGLDEFYAGMRQARRAPRLMAAVSLVNALRFAFGAAGLYFAVRALGWTVAPGLLIVLYTSASVLSTVSALPGEMVILGGSMAVLSMTSGVPRDIALMSMLLSRAIAFWLPIPVGYAALWNLRRQHYL